MKKYKNAISEKMAKSSFLDFFNLQHTLPMQGRGAKHSLSYWTENDDDDDDKHDEDDNNDDDDNGDGGYTQNSRK